MKNYYSRFRISLFTLALGLASVPFFNGIYDELNEPFTDLPKIESESPLFVFPQPQLSKFGLYKRNLIDKDRDLTSYEIGHPFSNCVGEDSEVKTCKKSRINGRAFIFNHLKEKKRAYIIYDWTGIDTGATEHIFVEPDENGRWQIILVIERDLRDSIDQDNMEFIKIKSVKYKRASEDDSFPTGTYYLSLIDENGEEIFEGL